MELGCIYWDRKGTAKKSGRQCGKHAQEGKEHCPRHVLIVAFEAEQEQSEEKSRREALRRKLEGKK